SKVLLDPFSRHRFLSYPSQGARDVIASFKTILFLTLLHRNFPMRPLILTLIPIIFLVLGGHFTCSRSLSADCHQALRLPSETCLKRTEQFRFTPHNGQDPSYGSPKTNSASTLACVSVLAPQPEPMVTLLTQVSIYSVPKASAQIRDGSMTTSSFEYLKSPLQLTIPRESSGIRRSQVGGYIEMEVEFGLADTSSRMAHSRNSTRIVASLLRIFPEHLQDLPKIADFHVTWQTSTRRQKTSMFLGKDLKTNLSLTLTLTSASCGTWSATGFIFRKKRNISTFWQYKSGKNATLTFFWMYNNCTASCYTRHSLFRKVAHILRPWRLCYVSPSISLFSHDAQSKVLRQTFCGGQRCCSPLSWVVQFPNHSLCMTQPHIPTPVRALELLSSLAVDGEPGAYSKAGKHSTVKRTLVGQKRLDSSYLLCTLSEWEDRREISESMGITKALSKDGETAAAGTKPSIQFSNESLILSTIPQRLTHSIQPISEASTTQRMSPQEESTGAQNPSFPSFPSHSNSEHSSSTPSSSPRIPQTTAQTKSLHPAPKVLLATVPMRLAMIVINPAQTLQTHSSSFNRNSNTIV
ncbi:hypothetical protein CY34DRAFT_762361, partial [Suillus luteus UH-Slu-Lm8-n1]